MPVPQGSLDGRAAPVPPESKENMNDPAVRPGTSRTPLWIALVLGFFVSMFWWPEGLAAFLPLALIGMFANAVASRSDSAIRALLARNADLEERIDTLERGITALRRDLRGTAAAAPSATEAGSGAPNAAAPDASPAPAGRAPAASRASSAGPVPAESAAVSRALETSLEHATAQTLASTQAASTAATSQVLTPAPMAASRPYVSPPPFARPVGPREPSAFDRTVAAAKAWLLGGNTVARVGLLVLFVGVAFLLRYVAEHTRIPIEVRLLGVAVLGLAFLVAGWRLRERKPGFAITLQGGAIGILYLTSFAALRLYGVLPPLAAFAFMAVLAVASGALAILQNARALAALGATGGFLAPLLVSTGEGRVAMLFSYYLLLNIGVLGVAWFRAWRELNWIAFVATFGVSGLWAVRRYTPEDFIVGQTFLALFWLLFLVVSVLYALRQTDRKRGVFDTTLVFALPLAAFGIQTRFTQAIELAFAAAIAAAAYLGLSYWLLRRRESTFQLLTEACFALGVGFLTLAVPLAASAQWTAAAWALEGLALLWVGQRQQRIVALAAGALLHALGALALARAYARGDVSLAAQWSGLTVNFAVLAVTAYLSSWLLDRARSTLPAVAAALPKFAWAGRALAWGWVALLLWQPLGFPWYVFAWYALAIALVTLERPDPTARIPTPEWVVGLALLVVGGFAAEARFPHDGAHEMQLLLRLALAASAVTAALMSMRSANATRRAAAGALLTLGVLAFLVAALAEAATRIHDPVALAQVALALIAVTAVVLTWLGTRLSWQWPQRLAWAFFAAHVTLAAFTVAQAVLDATLPGNHYGSIVWPLAWVLFYWRLGRDDRLPVKLPVAGPVHVAGLWLLTAMVAAEAALGLDRIAGAGWFHAAWGAVFALALWWTAQPRDVWPVRAAPAIHASIGIPGLAAFAALWLLLANAMTGGDPAPLVALPVLNPMDLAAFGVLAALTRWVLAARGPARLPAVRVALACAGFLVINVTALRAVHFMAGVAWTPAALGGSLIVQAVLSLLWTVTAMALMLVAHRRRLRPVWLTGAGLLGVVVAKLFVVDLSGQGTIERIVSFVGVGLLILVIGYLAPVPPARGAERTAEAS